MTAERITEQLLSLKNDEQRRVLMGFFKTGPGEYGEGDEFLGLKVPQTRKIVKEAQSLPLDKVPQLLCSRWHEVRLCGLLIMVEQFEALSKAKLIDDSSAIRQRDHILQTYLRHAERANNWDLVDLSAPKLLGRWLLLPTSIETPKQQVLDKLAHSNNLWRQRMSIVCTQTPSRHGDPSWCLRYAAMHLHHPHDLMHKAVGWMLREMGKYVDADTLRQFLHSHVREMPRTTLRYAIERLPDEERKYWMEIR